VRALDEIDRVHVYAFADKVLARRLVAQVRSPAEKADGAPLNAAAAVASPGGTR